MNPSITQEMLNEMMDELALSPGQYTDTAPMRWRCKSCQAVYTHTTYRQQPPDLRGTMGGRPCIKCGEMDWKCTTTPDGVLDVGDE